MRACITDSLRKVVTSIFGNSTATHSLRKGGALYYARGGADDSATQAPGGWRTTDIMKAIYTKMSPSEIEDELVRVARNSSVGHDIRNRMMLIGTDAEEVRSKSPAILGPFLANLAGRVSSLDTEMCKSTGVRMHVKWLLAHECDQVRALATGSHSRIRANHMSASASKRARHS